MATLDFTIKSPVGMECVCNNESDKRSYQFPEGCDAMSSLEGLPVLVDS